MAMNSTSMSFSFQSVKNAGNKYLPAQAMSHQPKDSQSSTSSMFSYTQFSQASYTFLSNNIYLSEQTHTSPNSELTFNHGFTQSEYSINAPVTKKPSSFKHQPSIDVEGFSLKPIMSAEPASEQSSEDSMEISDFSL